MERNDISTVSPGRYNVEYLFETSHICSYTSFEPYQESQAYSNISAIDTLIMHNCQRKL